MSGFLRGAQALQVLVGCFRLVATTRQETNDLPKSPGPVLPSVGCRFHMAPPALASLLSLSTQEGDKGRDFHNFLHDAHSQAAEKAFAS